MLQKKFAISLSLVIFFWLVTSVIMETGAVSGLCPPVDPANPSYECVDLGAGNMIEFLGSSDDTCKLSLDSPAIPCTKYTYRYTGTTTNQILTAIPTEIKVWDVYNAKSCQQYWDPGVGDPTTNFASGYYNLWVCRVAQNFASQTIFNIYAERSFFDRKEPNRWQLKTKTGTYEGPLLGPSTLTTAIVPITYSSATLLSLDNRPCSYTQDSNGNLTFSSDCGTNFKNIPLINVKLCLPIDPSDTTLTFPGDYNCQNISYMTEKTNIGLTGSDPCITLNLGRLYCW